MWEWIKRLFGKEAIVCCEGHTAGRALIVGNNDYPGCPLAGCIPDALNYEKLMVSHYDLDPKMVRVLKNATTKEMLEGLHWLTEACPCETVLFAYSGHGAQVPTGDVSEPDGLCEVACPIDFDWSAEHMITDKQFVAIFSKFQKGVKFHWVSDSCHSAGQARDVRTSKSYPTPFYVAMAIRRAISNGCQVEKTSDKLDVAFLSGCRSDQTSADTQDDKGNPCGALTYYFIKALREHPPQAQEDLIPKVARDLRVNGYAQVPQIEGKRKNMPFMS